MDGTREALARHHGGAQFRDVMERSFAGRFGAAYWRLWDAHVDPGLPADPTLVDLGTGPGGMLAEWADRYPTAQVIGVEAMPYMLEPARRRAAAIGARAQVIESDLQVSPLPLPDGEADVVLCSMVLHELPEPVALLAEIRRLMRPGARLVLLDWVRVPLAQYLDAQGRLGTLDLTRSEPEERQDVFQHFAEHNRYTVEDLRFLTRRFGLREVALEPLNGGQHVRAVFVAG